MKTRSFLGCMGTLMAALTMIACSSSDNNENTSENQTAYVWSTDGGLKACDHILFTTANAEDANGTQIGNGDDEFVFTGKQTIKKGTYTLKGWVYVADGAQLTIEPGTVIKGDKQSKAALIIERGGKLFAQGTATAPIVFTSAQEAGSRKPGDWGGLIICGKAKNNQSEMQIEGGPRTKHGGSDDTDNSGILSYVRIEFAGYPFQKDKEINGLTLGSVGSGTQIDHIQVSYSNDDSFEWFGGTVNCNNIVAYKGWDDDFDTDNGFSGKVQYALSVRDSRLADTSQSNGFESDNCADGAAVEPYTTCQFNYVTLAGPKALDSSFQNTTDYINGGSVNPNNGAALGKFQAGMHIRRNSRLCCSNAVIIGWPVGVIIDNEKGDCRTSAAQGLLQLRNITVMGCDALASDYNKKYEDVLCTDYANKTYDDTQVSWTHSWFMSTAYNNTLQSDILDYKTITGTGAFADGQDWTSGWTNFDPQNTKY